MTRKRWAFIIASEEEAPHIQRDVNRITSMLPCGMTRWRIDVYNGNRRAGTVQPRHSAGRNLAWHAGMAYGKLNRIVRPEKCAVRPAGRSDIGARETSMAAVLAGT